MRDSLLKRAGWSSLVVASAALGLWLWSRPLTEDAPVSVPAQAPPSAATPPPQRDTAPATPEATAAPTSTPAPASSSPSAAELTERAKNKLALDPAGALADIELADKLAGPADETRRVLEIHALVRLDKVGHARTLTGHFYRNFPASAHAAELERLTGYHPRPQGPGR